MNSKSFLPTSPMIFGPVVLAILALSGQQAWGATMILNNLSDGHSRKQGGSVVETSATIIAGEGGSGLEYRGFLTFEITNVTGTVSAAQLRLQVQSYNNGATFSSFRVWDYTSGPSPTSVIGGDSTARFNDLGGGVLYGAASITSALNPAGSFLAIDLNSDALAAMNTGSGVYVSGTHRFLIVGLADTNISGTDSFGVRFTSGTGTGLNQLAVQTVPEPSAAFLAGIGFALTGASRRLGWQRLRVEE